MLDRLLLVRAQFVIDLPGRAGISTGREPLNSACTERPEDWPGRRNCRGTFGLRAAGEA